MKPVFDTPESRDRLRSQLASGRSVASLAREYGVDRRTIERVGRSHPLTPSIPPRVDPSDPPIVEDGPSDDAWLPAGYSDTPEDLPGPQTGSAEATDPLRISPEQAIRRLQEILHSPGSDPKEILGAIKLVSSLGMDLGIKKDRENLIPVPLTRAQRLNWTQHLLDGLPTDELVDLTVWIHHYLDSVRGVHALDGGTCTLPLLPT